MICYDLFGFPLAASTQFSWSWAPQMSGQMISKNITKLRFIGCKPAMFTCFFSLLDFSNSLRWIEEVFKIPLSFHYTGWLMGIPLLDYYNPQYMKGSIIPKLISNQHLSVTSTHIFIFLMVKKIHSHSGEKSSTNRGFEHKITWGLRPTRTPGTLRPRLRRGSVASRIFQKGKSF